MGLLLIPLSAVAAAALISDGEEEPVESEDAVAVAEVSSTTVATSDEEIVETVFVTEAPAFNAAQLEAACADEGFELPGPPAPPAVVRTVTVVDPAPSTTTTMTDDDEDETGTHRNEEDDGHEDEDDDDHEDHEDEEDDECGPR